MKPPLRIKSVRTKVSEAEFAMLRERGRTFTTGEMQGYERELIERMKMGQSIVRCRSRARAEL